MPLLDATEATAQELLNGAVSTGMSNIADNIIGMLTTIVPIALGILAISLGIRFGIKYFMKIAGK